MLAKADVIQKFSGQNKPSLLGAIGDIQDNKAMIEAFLKHKFEFFNAIPWSINLKRQKSIGVGIIMTFLILNLYSSLSFIF